MKQIFCVCVCVHARIYNYAGKISQFAIQEIFFHDFIMVIVFFSDLLRRNKLNPLYVFAYHLKWLRLLLWYSSPNAVPNKYHIRLRFIKIIIFNMGEFNSITLNRILGFIIWPFNRVINKFNSTHIFKAYILTYQWFCVVYSLVFLFSFSYFWGNVHFYWWIFGETEIYEFFSRCFVVFFASIRRFKVLLSFSLPYSLAHRR